MMKEVKHVGCRISVKDEPYLTANVPNICISTKIWEMKVPNGIILNIDDNSRIRFNPRTTKSGFIIGGLLRIYHIDSRLIKQMLYFGVAGDNGFQCYTTLNPGDVIEVEFQCAVAFDPNQTTLEMDLNLWQCDNPMLSIDNTLLIDNSVSYNFFSLKDLNKVNKKKARELELNKESPIKIKIVEI